MPRQIGKTPAKRIRLSDDVWSRLRAAKEPTETWDEFLKRLLENYE